MKTKLFLLAFTIGLSLNVASSNFIVPKEPVKIDVSKKYPEKKINLTDIADITYIRFDSQKDNYLFDANPIAVTENTIIVHDYRKGDFFIFTIDGKFKYRFNHKGNGPGEYSTTHGGIYDEKNDELFVLTPLKIVVYDSMGKYKRSFPLPENCFPQEFIEFDENSFLFFDTKKNRDKLLGQSSGQKNNPTNFIRISKKDGRIMEYIPVPEDPFVLAAYDKGLGSMRGDLSYHIVKYKEGALVCNQETDTIFYYGKNGILTPVWIQTPSVKKMKTITYINGFIENSNYQFFHTTTLLSEPGERNPWNFLMRDKKDGSIYTQKIIFEEYKDYDLVISPQKILRNTLSNTSYKMLNAGELLEAYEENKLSGKLKEIVKNMKEEDNDILLLIRFK